MAFVFVVGNSDSPGSNSYASVDEYLAINAELGLDGVTDLTAVSDVTIQRHLVSATSFVDMLPWRGLAKHTDNVARLGLPRFSLVIGHGNRYLRPGDTIPDDEVPWTVVHAVCLLAEEERHRGKALWRPEVDRRDLLKSKRSIVGSVKVWEDPLAGREYPRVAALLTGLHEGPSASSARAIPTS